MKAIMCSFDKKAPRKNNTSGTKKIIFAWFAFFNNIINNLSR